MIQRPSLPPDVSKEERKRAYFAWYAAIRRECRASGLPMPTRHKRAKAATPEERTERLRQQNKKVRSKRREKDKLRHAAYYAKHKRRILARKAELRMAMDPAEARTRRRKFYKPKPLTAAQRERRSARHAERNATDVQYRIRRYLRKTLNYCLKAYGKGRGIKAVSSTRLVGCSIPELIAHIEGLWKSGMNWTNYGKWHIDHIRPCVSFDFSDLSQQMACFHYKNLQPLWAAENIRKRARMDWSPDEYREHG